MTVTKRWITTWQSSWLIVTLLYVLVWSLLARELFAFSIILLSGGLFYLLFLLSFPGSWSTDKYLHLKWRWVFWCEGLPCICGSCPSSAQSLPQLVAFVPPCCWLKKPSRGIIVILVIWDAFTFHLRNFLRLFPSFFNGKTMIQAMEISVLSCSVNCSLI